MDEIRETLEKIKEESQEIKDKIREQSAGYILGALGLVAGLAWNEAVKGLIEAVFPLEKNTVLAKFIYAVLITAFIVAATIIVNSLLAKKKSKK